MQGPNVKRLIAHRASLLAVPAGGGFADALKAIQSGKIVAHVREATTWVETALLLVREAAEPNPWKTADDEAIAGEILKGVEAKLRSQKAERRGLNHG